MIISKSKNFVFIHLEKCGGTSVEMALQPYLAWDDIILGSTKFGTAIQVAYQERYANEQSKNLLSKHSNAHDIKFYLDDKYNEMYKFAIVRNPVEILESLYFYSKKIADNFMFQESIDNSNMLDWAFNKMPYHWKNGEVYLLNYVLSEIDRSNINGFVKRMIKTKHSSVQPQTWRLTEDVDIYDLSKISDNWDKIIKKIGIDEDVILEKINSSKKYDNIVMSASTIKLIKKQFKPDYDWMPKRLGVTWNG